MLESIVAHFHAAVVDATPRLMLDAVLTAMVGMLLYYAKREVDNRAERLGTLDHLDRVVTGEDDDRHSGVIDVMEVHDAELSEAQQHRKNIERRMRVTEQRVDRIAEEAGVRNGLEDMSKRLRERAEEKFAGEGIVDDGPWDIDREQADD